MAKEFFAKKRDWSKYKDFILGYYLEPYIPKVAKLRRPILIIDGFAGQGKFDDGEPGSPIIISDAIQKWHQTGIDVAGGFIEADEELFQSLQACLKPYGNRVVAKQGTFSQHLPAIAKAAERKSIFLYVDPYTVKGLNYDEMKAVYEGVQQASRRSSIEVLLNLNSATFMRWALAALSRKEQWIEGKGLEGSTGLEDIYDSAEPDELTRIAGGEYWKDIANDTSIGFPAQVLTFTDHYCRMMENIFDHVCCFPIKEKYKHLVPKYYLVYATRHIDGLILMNDAMCKARRGFLAAEFDEGRFFDVTPASELFEPAQLEDSVLSYVGNQNTPCTRKRIREHLVKEWFCRVETKEMNQAVGNLLKRNRLFSDTGRSRINDQVRLSVVPFDSKK